MNTNNNSLAFEIGPALNSPFGTTTELGTLITNSVQAAIVIAGVILVLLFLYGGFLIVKGSGKTDPQSYQKAKDYVQYAILGFIIVVMAYIIVQAIEVILGGQRFITRPKF